MRINATSRKPALRSPTALATAIQETARFGGTGSRMVSDSGEFNAHSKADLRMIVAELASHIKKGTFDDVTVAAAESEGVTLSASEAKRARNELLAAAWNDPSGVQFEEVGANIAATINQRTNREGIMRRILGRADIQQGQIPRFRSKVNNVRAVTSNGPVTVGIQVLRDRYVFPDEFTISTNLRIEEKEIQQGSPDLLEDKFFEGLEAIMVEEDRRLRNMLVAAAPMSNDIQYYSGNITPAVIENLRKQIEGWGIPVNALLAPSDLQSAFLTGAGFNDFFEPVTKLLMFTTGMLGNFFGIDILTDAFRDPVLKVLDAGEIIAVGSPEYLGGYTDRGPVKSEARINTEDFPGRGWYQHELISMAISNPRAVARAVKI